MRSLRLGTSTLTLALVGSTLGGGGLGTVAAATLPVYRVDAVVADAIATAVNEAGDFVGWQTVGGSPRAFVHHAGAATLLPTPADRPLSVARDVNDAGTVVGYAYKTTIDEPGNAMRWTQGTTGWTVQDLGFLAGDLVSEATGINDAGLIVGRSNPRSFLQEHGFRWTAAAGMAPLLPGWTFVPQDVNETGIAVGNGYSSALRADTATGVGQNMPAPFPYGYSHAYAINDAGQVAGALTSSSGGEQVVARHSPATGWQVLGGIGGSTTHGYVENLGWGINSSGTVVGVGWPRTGAAPYQRAVIYLDTAASLLYVDDLLEAGSQWSIYAAFDINDAGQIVGRARNLLTGQWAAVRLSPIGSQPPTPPPDTTAPTVRITYPLAGATVGKVVDVRISATDNVSVARVELRVDTKLAGACTALTSGSYSCRWNTRNWATGYRTLYARAWDGAGNVGLHSITVRVANGRR